MAASQLDGDAWQAYKIATGGEDYRWLSSLEAWCEETGTDLRVALAREALKTHAASQGVVEALEHARNSACRMARELRELKAGTAA